MFTHRRGIALVVSNFQLPLAEASEHTEYKIRTEHTSQAQAPNNSHTHATNILCAAASLDHRLTSGRHDE